MDETIRCPKCQSDMERGFIMDNTYGGAATAKWIEGAPEKSFWTGIKVRSKDEVEIMTYRCVRCGFLESYAR